MRVPSAVTAGFWGFSVCCELLPTVTCQILPSLLVMPKTSSSPIYKPMPMGPLGSRSQQWGVVGRSTLCSVASDSTEILRDLGSLAGLIRRTSGPDPACWAL